MTSRTYLPALLFVLLPAAAGLASSAERISTVAVFPVENVSGRSAPVEDIGRLLSERLASEGIGILPASALDDFMTRHRVRYAAGIDSVTARSLKLETGVDAVVIASVELFSDTVPPKLALFARLVSVQAAPTVLWADDAGLAGNDAPGLLELGLVNDQRALMSRAIDRLSRSLLAYINTGEAASVRSAAKFRPKYAYEGLRIERGQVLSVAVLPFFNVSERRNAGEILALLFMRHLAAFDCFRVVDMGDVRQQLLQGRVIMDGGVSITDAELVGDLVAADLIVGGRVLYYQDYDGADGSTRVEFSIVVIERRTRRVVWSSHSYNEGNDGVRFFGRGRSTNAHAMATQMVGLTAQLMAYGQK